MQRKFRPSGAVTISVLVAALGYFVDIYDLLLFGIVRVPSLRAIGVNEADLLSEGIRLINAQMSGMLLGGILWGVLGDRRGRLSVLFGSIFLYSLANIANAYVTTPGQYALLRFFAGIGLAGELGAAITLVAELLPQHARGIGTTIVASLGILGAVLASWVGDHFDWKTAYMVGGFMGLFLLVMRLKMLDSGLYEKMADQTHIKRGHFHLLLQPRRILRYLCCIFIGVPIWFVIGILITFSPELARALEVLEPIRASQSIMFAYIGLALGDFASGMLSQKLKSRKKVIALFLMFTTAAVFYYLYLPIGMSAKHFYSLCILLGFSTGYWAVFVTVGAEQFGTNLRNTVATTAPNFVRGSVVLLTMGFEFLRQNIGFDLRQAALAVGVFALALAFLALSGLDETFSRNLDFFEH